MSEPLRRMSEREFVLLMGVLTALSAMAIDITLPAFAEMRPAFGLDDDSTRLSLTVTLFLMGAGVGHLFYGPIADAAGRKPTLAGGLLMYAAAALAAALAPSLGVLYTARFVWGFAAAGPRVLTQAIVRDRFAGTAMARVMTLIQTVFFIAPITAPGIGKALVVIGSWRWVMAFGVVTSLAAVAWILRLDETLDPAHRRPLRLGPMLAGFRFVIANRTALGYTLMVTFGFGAFLAYLGSTELILSDVYDRSSWFVPYFTVAGVVAAVVALSSNRLLHRIHARRLTLGAGSAFAAVSAVLFAVTVAAGGLPPFGVWLVLFSLANAIHVAVFPSGVSLAMEPMGEMAGTAASAIGVSTWMLGSLLASFTDRAIDGSVMPIGVAYLTYTAIALACQLWARGG
ncbi:MAG: multidrug effflux MFS transporter [Acidimicrobiaceae bacterium]|nr:multidrug effflux MFS transporter [Acidimicrobiaceae bacterium]MXZ98619.1 multidrug effflux MFS transporter [Acidimicrobiaceae bacterium]MYE66071.1 multidrug effflux MFS transporter [Acidimicrobiaceae bacterium]MYE96927.1 multidrug effflux MFS transporter [Acidimicrobiaceae bacterium]MYI54203.1 multidrug effflux MFS transporter [Acidimicrobiaceae bacterium]